MLLIKRFKCIVAFRYCSIL